MMAISLWQPWASAIALGLKHNETRHWSTNYRGPIAIHAARSATKAQKELFDQFMDRGDFNNPMTAAKLFSFSMLPKGAIVAVAELIKVVPTEFMLECDRINELEMELGDYGRGRFAWLLSNVKPLKTPYGIAGHQGLFTVPDGIKDMV